jgi:hypothetical protein
VCITEWESNGLTLGFAKECDAHTTQMPCDADPDCNWEPDFVGSGIAKCVPGGLAWAGAMDELVSKAVTHCQNVANDNDIDPTPACNQMTQGACEAAGCAWNAGTSSCFFDGITCVEAVVEDMPLNDGTCEMPSADCFGIGSGGEEDDGEDDEEEGGPDDDADESAGVEEPWGDLDALIYCTVSACTLDQALIEAVVNDPYPMLDDSARLAAYRISMSLAGHKLTGIDTSEPTGALLDALGLQNDDVFLLVDDLPLETFEDVLIAVDHLNSVSQTEIRIRRGGSTITRTYDIAVNAP